jgi:sphingolipid delta-4 desaturase
MGGPDDFYWVGSDEPHASRRREILKAHPEIKTLMGHDPKSKWICTVLVLSQVIAAYMLRAADWWVIAGVAWVFGGVVNHALELAIHEMSHNLFFKKPIHNRIFSLFCNFPMVFASAITFKKYHLEHHKYQGVHGVDVDIPTEFEGKFFRNPFTKLVWVFLQAAWYALRPMFIRPKPVNLWETANWAACIAFDVAIIQYFGARSFTYLLLCDLLGLGLHPVAGHFIAEHYVYVKGFATYSYYGSHNMLRFNVGSHNEHHDFPNIPGSRLWQVKAMAPEFYDHLPHHTSYIKVIWDFIMDPSVGCYSRIKRMPTGKEEGEM